MRLITVNLLSIAPITFTQSVVKQSGSMNQIGKETFKASILLETISKTNLYGVGPQKEYDPSTSFPFRISGTLTELTTHVVAPLTADVTGYKSGRSQEYDTLSKVKSELLGFIRSTIRVFIHQRFVHPFSLDQ